MQLRVVARDTGVTIGASVYTGDGRELGTGGIDDDGRGLLVSLRE